MDRDKIARLLVELAKVGDIEKCRMCHCYVDVLRQVQEDISSRDLYLSVVRRGLVSRLDHAAYLGYELGRAESALRSGARYVQDRHEP